MTTMAISIADFDFRVEGERVKTSDVKAGARERDGADVRASLDGNQDAYARLVARYQPHVFRQMWHFTRDLNVQDELVQEVFIEVYHSLAKFRGDAPLLHWIRRIATRTGYRYWRQKARRHRLEEAIERARTAPVCEPEDLTAAEAAECLHGLLAELPAAERLILTLSYFEGLDSPEIAERMGWNATLVRVRAHRARQKLRVLLEKAGFGGFGSRR